jgi:hypothetical protein
MELWGKPIMGLSCVEWCRLRVRISFISVKAGKTVKSTGGGFSAGVLLSRV